MSVFLRLRFVAIPDHFSPPPPLPFYSLHLHAVDWAHENVVYYPFNGFIRNSNSLNSFKNTIRKKNLEALLEEGCHNCPLCSN